MASSASFTIHASSYSLFKGNTEKQPDDDVEEKKTAELCRKMQR